MPKKVFAVAYGGGHIRIVDAICRQLVSRPNIELRILALTTAYPTVIGQYKRGVVKRMVDYLPLFDNDVEAILAHGLRLLPENFTPGVGVSRFETIAYLGLSYFDLEQRLGCKEAAAAYESLKRHAFLPVTVMKRILEHESPGVVLATTSPKCEQAAFRAGNELGMETVDVLDLFGVIYPPPEANHIVVLNAGVEKSLRDQGFTDRRYYQFGQPVFDDTVCRVEAVDAVATKRQLGLGEKVLLFATQRPTQTSPRLQTLCSVPYQEAFPAIFGVLEEIRRGFGIDILVRLHPNEQIEDYRPFFDRYPAFLFVNPHLSLFESIAVTNYVLTPHSTVGVEALLCGKTVFTFQRDDEVVYPTPGADREPFIFSRGSVELRKNLRAVLKDGYSFDLSSFYQRGAAEKIADLLYTLAEQKGGSSA